MLGPDERALRRQAEAMDAGDPRLDWLLAQAPRWRDAGEKTLVFVAHRETLEMLRTALSHRAQLASGVFHEELSPARRDTEVARFREPDGPSLLVSTECGGEGRNFEFCRRLVLFDLPWKPSIVEQRIGRLDRIGRRIPVDDRATSVRLAGSARMSCGSSRRSVSSASRSPGWSRNSPTSRARSRRSRSIQLASLSGERFEALVSEAHAARTRIREAAYQQLHRDPYRSEMAAGILARVPAELDALNEEVVVTACIGLGFTIERPRGRRIFAIELGNGALVDGLPGVPGGSSYVGSFDREEAVEDETIDFFASGHPLVEGIFAHFEESAAGPGRAVRGRNRPGAGRGTRGRLQGRAGVRGCRVRLRRSGSARLGGGVPPATAPRAPGDRRADRGPPLEEHGSPAGCAARPGAPSACARGDRRAAGSVSHTQARRARILPKNGFVAVVPVVVYDSKIISLPDGNSQHAWTVRCPQSSARRCHPDGHRETCFRRGNPSPTDRLMHRRRRGAAPVPSSAASPAFQDTGSDPVQHLTGGDGHAPGVLGRLRGNHVRSHVASTSSGTNRTSLRGSVSLSKSHTCVCQVSYRRGSVPRSRRGNVTRTSEGTHVASS